MADKAGGGSLFSAYVTNLGKYNEGELAGEFLKFPTTTEAVRALLKRIGVDGVRYEAVFMTDYDTNLAGLRDCLGEHENIDELNHLACLLSELDEDALHTFEAALEMGKHTSSVKEIINLAENLDCYDFYPGVTDGETLGRIYVDVMETLDVPEQLENYFDYEAYGRDAAINEGGQFVSGGYVRYGGGFREVYSGREDIPKEHRVFAFPKLNIREQLAAYAEVARQAIQRPAKTPPEQGHEDR